MKCPIDGSQLAITERQNVEIDYCPQCRGVWLDRGELDKIIEKSEAAQPPTPTEGRPVQPRPSEHSSHHYSDNHYYKKKKRESFLGDLFDF